MNAMPRASAVQPAWPATAGSPRPRAWPTRTAPAEARPRGIMKVTRVSRPSSRPMPKMATAKKRAAPQADRADGLGAQAADEEGVDDAHGHPAQLGQDHGPGQPEHGPQLGSHPLPEPTHGVTPILRRVRRGRCRVGRRPGRHGDEGQGSARGASPASRGLPGRGAT